MNTIYNLLNTTEPIDHGVIEVFNMYDYSHYLIVLDGEVMAELETDDYEDFLLDPKFLKKALKKSGVEPHELIFVYYSFELFARKVVDYDMNNYGYKEMYHLVKNNISKSNELQTKILYHGVTM